MRAVLHGHGSLVPVFEAGHGCAETHLHIVDSARAVFGHYEFGQAAYVAA